VGNAFRQLATSAGHEVVPIVRSRSQAGIYWNPATGEVDRDRLRGADAVVNLAGENVAQGRWTAEKKNRIRSSRVDGTRVLAGTLTSLSDGPRLLVNASAIGFYGDQGDRVLDEDSESGTGFLADVCRDWEAATEPAEKAGVRVVRMRLGVVLSKKGGALAKMLLPFRLGLGGIVGSGRQHWSWIALEDVAGAFMHVIEHSDLRGAVNVVAPHPVTNREFTKALGRVLGRPTFFPMPALAARLVLGEMADELLLSSTRVIPEKLNSTGYRFRLPDLEAALRTIVSAE
jgi:uncharacterized protein (TIGR01777 family)